jgi:hypothetical protein
MERCWVRGTLRGIRAGTEHSARIYRPSFRENKLKRYFSIIENERFGLVFAKTGSINSGTVHLLRHPPSTNSLVFLSLSLSSN